MRAAVRLRARLGRRGAYLLTAGVGWLLYGVQLQADPRPGTIRSAAVMRELAPLDVWGWTWIGLAAVAIVGSWSRCPVRRAVGFAAATGPPLLWAGAYAVTWAAGEAPQAWAGAATWAGAALRLMIVAGWPPPPSPRPREAVRDG